MSVPDQQHTEWRIVAHALADHLAEVPARQGWYQTATLYHLVHAIPILIAGRLAVRGRRAAAPAALLFLAGVVLFSGSLYAMALTDQRWLGMVTPFGGLSLMLGWLALAIVVWREPGRPGTPQPPSPSAEA